MVNLDNYPLLKEYATEMAENFKYESLGVDGKMKEIYSVLNQRRMKSMIIIGEPGVGKTNVIETLAKHTQKESDGFIFFSIDLDVMGGQGNNEFGKNIKGIVKEAIELDENSSSDVVLFIDEFHKVGMEGYEAGLDAFKTVLARGQIRLIGATTNEEYTIHVEKNQALTERLELVTIDELPDDIVKTILKDMWKKELGDIEPVNDKLIDKIVEYGKYMPSNSNPRKSIRLLDRMIGIYTTQNVAMNEALLDKVVYERSGVNTKMRPDIDKIEQELKDNIKGQDQAIKVLIDSLHVAMAGLNPPNAPMGSYIFMGPTGVGKTLTAKILAKGLFGSEEAMLRYDMSEYQGEGAVERWQKDASEDIGRKPYSIILCDEGEKSNRGVLDLLLQITSDGRLKNKYGRPVTFKNAYIIITTNIGFTVIEENRTLGTKVSDGAYDTEKAKKILQSEDGRNGFRPELVNRMNGIISFNPLEKDVRKQIVEKELKDFKQYLQSEEKIILEYGDRVIKYLYDEDISDATSAGGGRDINNRIRNYLYVSVAKVINKYLFDSDRKLCRVKVEPLGELVSERPDKRISTAELKVLEYDVINKDGRLEKYTGQFHENVKRSYDALDEKANVSYEIINV
ncbi:AAA family ATPase [Staphylococcus sp. ACRSN]|uniref:AAA family ATPase n=1 Tax=Staphylococcus TaxID=1279 RepID=UPI001EF3866B|nr:MULTISPECIES: AAA family ATPase [Staphylococcus]MCG7340158.1 AAA family ATPase [Staphylococcus sp. ACRSN]MEB6279103.1 AAA family ATPase [Staphylococcus gallinarum]